MADFENRNVGARIRAMRQERDWSAERVAKESAYLLDRTAIWKVENGKRRLKFEEAVALANVFGVPLEHLTGPSQSPVETDNAGDRPIEPERVAQEPAGPRLVGRLRRPELDTLIAGLTAADGQRFWLVTAPPGFGKTTLLNELCRELKLQHDWTTNLLDLRRHAAEFRDSPDALLARLTDVVLPNEAELLSGQRTGLGMAADDVYRAAAQHISKQGKPLLCALDSAEALSRNSARHLRNALNQVSGLIEDSGNPKVRLTFVVSSSLVNGWRGRIPQPELSVLPLPEFDADTVEKRLRDAAGEVRAANITADKFRSTASLVQQVTGGVPELLHSALDWIEREQWIDIYRLGHRDVFESVVTDFIDNRLLAADSLLPTDGTPSGAKQAVVREAVESLVRYRFFTKAHVKHHVDSDKELRQAFDAFGGGLEGLWDALSDTALLTRPLDEPWQAFHPAVRRLLFTYFYKTDEERARAHQEASALTFKWVTKASGKDQVTGMLADLWHDAEVLRFRHADRPADKLRGRVAELREAVRSTEGYSETELLSYAADSMAEDVELQESIGSAELAEELADMMAGREVKA